MTRRPIPTALAVLLLAAWTQIGAAQQSSLLYRQPQMRSPTYLTNPLVELPTAGGQGDPQGETSSAGRQPTMQRVASPGDMTYGTTGGGVGIASASWTYTPPPTTRTFRIEDIVTIRVDELARMRAEGRSETRRNLLYDALLRDWFAFSGGKLRANQFDQGNPRATGQSQQLLRADAAIESREALAFSVAARVVDIQPNGNLVLEANKTLWVNDNLFETSLMGICRAQDIGPDNVILSRDLLDLNIRKDEKGHLRDSYKRGWLSRWISELNPF